MAQSLLAWFVFLLVIGVFAAYVAGTALGPGADYMLVFRLTSTVAFASHALAVWLGYIWYSQGLGYTVRTTIDGLIFALVTGGLFGWLWPA